MTYKRSTKLRIIIIADNLSGGGALLAKNIIQSILERPTCPNVIVLGSPKLQLSERTIKKLAIYKETKHSFPSIIIGRIRFVRSQQKADIILNLTNFPIGTKFLQNGNEICLLHNAYLFTSLRTKLGYDLSFLFQLLLKILTLRLLIKLSDKDKTSFLVQTDWMRECVRKKVSIKFHLMKTGKHDWPILTKLNTLDENIDNINEKINHLIKDKTSWFYPASAEPHKNHFELLKLFAEATKINRNIILFLTLPEKSKFSKLILKRITDLSMEKHVYNLGWIEENVKNYMLYRCDGIVFFSNFESLGLPLIEILKLEKPTIVLKSAVSLEILGSGDHLYDLFSYDEEIQNNERKRLIADILSPIPHSFSTNTENQRSIADAYLKLDDII